MAIQTAGEFTGGGLSYGAIGLPPTLSIDTGNGIITGIPDLTDFGNSPFSVEVTATGGPMPQVIQFLIVVDNDFDVVFFSGIEDTCIGL